MWEINYKESWVLKNWCFWTVVLQGTLESPLDCKEIQPVHPEGDKSWVFIGRTDVEAETPIFWPPVVKNWLIKKDSDAGKDWRQEKGMIQDETVGWYHWLNDFEQDPGVGDGQGSLACYSPWGRKELEMTDWLNNNNVCKVISCSMVACVLSHCSGVWLLATLWTIARQAPLSMGFFRQEYQRGLPCPSPEDLPHKDQTHISYLLPWQAGSLPLAPPGTPA